MQLEDGAGSKLSVSLEGKLTREKVLKLIDMVDSLGAADEEVAEPVKMPGGNTFGKLFQLIEQKFYLGSFSSGDVLEAYEDEYAVPIRLSTVSTYLARLVERDLLSRQMGDGAWMYSRIRLPIGR